jgi:uncharacterized phage infection (PIP) family protein YhgE
LCAITAMEFKTAKISKTLVRNISRMILRGLPLIPGHELYDIFVELKEGKKSINSKIDKAYNSLKETSELISDLESDLNERTEKVKELSDTYEEYSKLAKIEEDKIQPLLNQLEKTVGKGRNIERIVSFFINIVAGLLIFILGIWLSPKIKELIRGTETPVQQSEKLKSPTIE